MRLNTSSNIYWGKSLTTAYSFGTTLRFKDEHGIYFKNDLVPSGEVLQEWSSEYNYQVSRKPINLPLLKKGKTYVLYRKMISHPERGVFLRIIFFDRYHKEIEKIIEKEDSLTFTYPINAYTYKIQLISAGMFSFDFDYLTIKEKE